MAGVGKGPEVVAPEVLMELMGPHIDSYNYFVERGLPMAVANVQPVEVLHPVTNVHLRNILSSRIFDGSLRHLVFYIFATEFSQTSDISSKSLEL